MDKPLGEKINTPSDGKALFVDAFVRPATEEKKVYIPPLDFTAQGLELRVSGHGTNLELKGTVENTPRSTQRSLTQRSSQRTPSGSNRSVVKPEAEKDPEELTIDSFMAHCRDGDVDEL